MSRSRSVLASAVAATLLAGCGATGTPEDAAPASREPGPTTAADEAPTTEPVEPVLAVVTTVAPVADLVAQVGGDRVEVRSLVPPGSDSHTYEPRPGDVAMLADADAYLGIGLDLNPAALQLAETQLPEGAPVVMLGELTFDEDELVLDHVHGDGTHTHEDGTTHSHGDDTHTHEDGTTHSHGDDTHTHEDGTTHSHGDDTHTHEDGTTHSHADEEPAGHDGAGPNPHVWTSVQQAAALVDTIAAQLTELDPAGADGYAERAAATTAALEELDEAIGAAVATIPDDARTLITYHDAWTYFARDHGLEHVTAVQAGDHSEPSAAELREVIELIRAHDVPAIFGSEVFPTRVLDAIASETGATYVGDLADDELPGEPGDPEHSYLELMRRNAALIVGALGGDPSALDGEDRAS